MRDLKSILMNKDGGTHNFGGWIPGMEITSLITDIVEYCGKHNVVATLDFNGYTNRIEHWVDPNELASVWYTSPNHRWYDDHKKERRNDIINDIING